MFSVNIYFSQAIKIYVTDTETNKNISNAKVCLEGFEIPPIKAQYNKKENYYYFKEIPENYNTVMVYHKNYNEKGFQRKDGLLEILYIKLHSPILSSSSFFGKDNFYIEDPYKIVLSSGNHTDYNTFRKYITSYIQKNNLEIEFINPAMEKYKLENNIPSDKEPYPILSDKSNGFPEGYSFPTKTGMDSHILSECKEYQITKNDIVFFFRKKNRKKFKRYNDPIINKLGNLQNIVISTVIYSKGEYIFQNQTPDIFYKYRDEKNIKFFKNKDVSHSSFYLYDNRYSLKKEETKQFPFYNILETSFCNPSFKLINKSMMKSYINKDFSEIEIQNSTGLGILDVYEYYSDNNHKNNNK